MKGLFAGSAVEPVINNPDQLTVLVDGVKVTFLAYPFPVLTPFVSIGNLNLLSIPEIAPTKAYSIGRCGTYKDSVDLYFVLKGGYTTPTAPASSNTSRILLFNCSFAPSKARTIGCGKNRLLPFSPAAEQHCSLAKCFLNLLSEGENGVWLLEEAGKPFAGEAFNGLNFVVAA